MSVTVDVTKTGSNDLFMQDGTGAVARSENDKLRESVSVKDFGAVGDGLTDDTAAVRAWIRALVTSAGLGLLHGYVPHGIYRITESGVLNDINTTYRTGLLITGDGYYTSIFRLDTSGVDLWFYDNGTTAALNNVVFSGIGFEGLDPAIPKNGGYGALDANAKGFRLYSASTTGSHEQSFQFHHCRFDSLDVVESNEGDNTSSEIKYIGCKIKRIRSTVKNINNLQSVNHEYISTDIEQIYGDIFSINGLGGGAIKMYGGSVILFDNGVSDTYFIRIAGSGAPINDNPLVFSGQRIELRGERTKMAIVATTTSANLCFENGLVLGTNLINKTLVSIGAYADVKFRAYHFNEQEGGLFNFEVTTTSGYGQNGTITFDACVLATDWSDRCTITSTFGAIRAVNCRGSNIGSSNDGVSWAHDFDMHWNAATAGNYTAWEASGTTLTSDGSFSDGAFRLKTAQIKLPRDYWPATSEWKLKLPKNAIIKAVHLRKPQLGTDATVTQVVVGRDDKSGTPHVSGPAQEFNLAMSASADNIFYHVGSSANERTLRLYATVAPTQATQGGVAIVEYY